MEASELSTTPCIIICGRCVCVCVVLNNNCNNCRRSCLLGSRFIYYTYVKLYNYFLSLTLFDIYVSSVSWIDEEFVKSHDRFIIHNSTIIILRVDYYLKGKKTFSTFKYILQTEFLEKLFSNDICFTWF